MKRRILLVDDEVAVLLTLKAVLEISGFDVDTAASAREGKSRLRRQEYHMVITDMRMERESSGHEVIAAARAASCKPAIALLTAFPVSDESWQEGGADKLLVKPMQTRVLLEQIEKLFVSHEAKLAAAAIAGLAVVPVSPAATASPVVKKAAANTKKAAANAKKAATKKTAGKKPTTQAVTKKPAATIKVVKRAAKVVKRAAKKSAPAAAKKTVRKTVKAPSKRVPVKALGRKAAVGRKRG
jgi:DNA-binding response OmpR family regulator